MHLCCAEFLPSHRHTYQGKGSSFLCVSHIFILNSVLFFSFSFCSKGRRVLCKIDQDSPCRADDNYSAFRANIGGSKWQKKEQYQNQERNWEKCILVSYQNTFQAVFEKVKKIQESSLFLGNIYWYGCRWLYYFRIWLPFFSQLH